MDGVPSYLKESSDFIDSAIRLHRSRVEFELEPATGRITAMGEATRAFFANADDAPGGSAPEQWRDLFDPGDEGHCAMLPALAAPHPAFSEPPLSGTLLRLRGCRTLWAAVEPGDRAGTVRIVGVDCTLEAIAADLRDARRGEELLGRSMKSVGLCALFAAAEPGRSLDAGTRLAFVTPQLAYRLGHHPRPTGKPDERATELVGTELGAILTPETIEQLARTLENGSGPRVRGVFRTHDGGSWETMLVALESRNLFGGREYFLAGIDRSEDIVRLQELNAELDRTRTLLHAILHGSPDWAVIACDPTGRILFWNHAAERLTGYTRAEVEAAGLETIVPPRLRSEERNARLFNEVNRHGFTRVEEPVLHRSGEERVCRKFHSHIFTPSGRHLGYTTVMHDISEESRLRTHLLQAQKMQSLGTLAGGIAHDFNNLLTAILGNASLLTVHLDAQGEIRDLLDGIQSAGTRAANLTRRMLDFSRQRAEERRPLAINRVVGDVVTWVQRSLPSSIDLRVRCGDGDATIDADETQIHQAISNLCVNARDAIESTEHATGRILIETDVVERAVADLPDDDLRPGAYVRIAVNDDGPGIDPATRGRIFDPFFTTKPPGRGTGLGLAVVYAIMERHNGFLEVPANTGGGSRFELFFPVSHGRERDSDDGAPPDGPPATGTGRILVVDDEDLIADTARRLLTAVGYEATAVFSATEAIERVENAPAGWDVVLLDLTMPAPGGPACARAIHGIAPDLPVVLMTGSSAEQVDPEGIAPNIVDLLQKPFAPNTLATTIRRAILGATVRSRSAAG